jgi:hypothetical protein
VEPHLAEHWEEPVPSPNEPNVKTVFKRNPEYFLTGQPYIDPRVPSIAWISCSVAGI